MIAKQGCDRSRFELTELAPSDQEGARDNVESSAPRVVALLDHLQPGTPPFAIHFDRAQIRARLRPSELKRELLIRATGLLGNSAGMNQAAPVVWDTTAGLGVESLLMAATGAVVVGFEREPLLAALLKNALERYRTNQRPQLKLSFQTGEFAADRDRIQDWLTRFGVPDVVYFDPMFFTEAVNAKSLPKKGMQILRELTQPETTQEFSIRLNASVRLFSQLVSADKNIRFVVKQPFGSKDHQLSLFRLEEVADRSSGWKLRRFWVTGKLVEFEVLILEPELL